MEVENKMIEKTELSERKYLLIGLLTGALFGIIGNFMSGYYFYTIEHPEQSEFKWYFGICVGVTIILILFIYHMIRILDKKSR